MAYMWKPWIELIIGEGPARSKGPKFYFEF